MKTPYLWKNAHISNLKVDARSTKSIKWLVLCFYSGNGLGVLASLPTGSPLK